MTLSQATPEIPVPSVVAAMDYHVTRLGFAVEWHRPDDCIGVVAQGDCAVFFRETVQATAPATLRIFVADLDHTFAEMTRLCTDITAPIKVKPRGQRQFSVRDLNGHLFHFHHDV